MSRSLVPVSIPVSTPEPTGVHLVVYAGWAEPPSPGMVGSVTELVDLLQELVADAIPGAHTMASVSVGEPLAAAAPVPDRSDFWIDRRDRRVTVEGREVALTRREFDLLAFLDEHPRQVFTRTELLRHVWHDENRPSGRTVDVHIRRLRAKLGCEEHRLATVRGVGYRHDAARRHRKPSV